MRKEEQYAKIVYQGIKDVSIWPSYINDYLESRDEEFLKELYRISVQEISNLEEFNFIPASLLNYLEDDSFCKQVLREEIDNLTEKDSVSDIFKALTPRNYMGLKLLKDPVFIRELIEKYINRAENCEDFTAIGDFIMVNSKAEDAAADMYKSAYTKAKSFDDYRNLAWSIGFDLKDPIWGFEVLMKATGKIENTEQAGLLLSCANSIDLDEKVFAIIQKKILGSY